MLNERKEQDEQCCFGIIKGFDLLLCLAFNIMELYIQIVILVIIFAVPVPAQKELTSSF